MKYVGMILLFFVSYFIIGYTAAALHLFALPLFKFESQIQMNQDIIRKTYNADNAIYNYEWFKDRYEAIQAIDTKISNTEESYQIYKENTGDQKNWTFEDKTEIARLQSVVLGLKNHKEDLIAEYNSRAKQANRNIFQDRLPLFIDLK